MQRRNKPQCPPFTVTLGAGGELGMPRGPSGDLIKFIPPLVLVLARSLQRRRTKCHWSLLMIFSIKLANGPSNRWCGSQMHSKQLWGWRASTSLTIVNSEWFTSVLPLPPETCLSSSSVSSFAWFASSCCTWLLVVMMFTVGRN